MRNLSEREYPWRDGNVLRELYWKEGMSTTEVANELDTHQSVIQDWMERHDIPRRTLKRQRGGEWRDEDTMRELYEEKGLSIEEVSNTVGCSHRTVRVWLEKHGIDIRDAQSARISELLSRPAPFEMNDDGYEIWRTGYDGETYRMKVHRLLAIAEYGADCVNGNVVHHKNNIPWDNRPDNVEVMSQSEHASIHTERGEQ